MVIRALQVAVKSLFEFVRVLFLLLLYHERLSKKRLRLRRGRTRAGFRVRSAPELGMKARIEVEPWKRPLHTTEVLRAVPPTLVQRRRPSKHELGAIRLVEFPSGMGPGTSNPSQPLHLFLHSSQRTTAQHAYSQGWLAFTKLFTPGRFIGV